MVITFIGLSGCGKTHLASRLATEKGFTLYCCDELVEKRLSDELLKEGHSSIRGVAEWMGQPFESSYPERESAYLRAEIDVMQELISMLGTDGWGMPTDTVIDTTGSVVYCGREILSAIKARSRIIYLAIPDSELEFMFQQYLNDPKPVIWNSVYQRLETETPEEALGRCYPKLVRQRAKLYQEYADVTLVMDRPNRDRFSVRSLLQLAGAR